MLIFLEVLLGVSLLVAGRKLFWLLVGGIGFVVGVALAGRYFPGSELGSVLAGLVLGIIFALMAIFMESTAILLAGFLGGGYVFFSIAKLLGVSTSTLELIAVVAGGILGLAVIAFWFDWALIGVSSLVGASMVMGGLRLLPAAAALLFIGLLLAGVVIQRAALRREPASTEPRSK